MRQILLLLTVILGTGLCYAIGAFDRSPDQEPVLKNPGTDQPKPLEPVTSPPVSATASILPPEPIPDGIPEKQRTFELPDGTRQPVLNQAYGAPKMLWPKEIPWSPIVRTIRGSKGLDWYEHADGSMSITQMVMHTHLGRIAPITNVFNPTTPLPLEGSENDPSTPTTKTKLEKH